MYFPNYSWNSKHFKLLMLEQFSIYFSILLLWRRNKCSTFSIVNPESTSIVIDIRQRYSMEIRPEILYEIAIIIIIMYCFIFCLLTHEGLTENKSAKVDYHYISKKQFFKTYLAYILLVKLLIWWDIGDVQNANITRFFL